ncbi:uncharacterized protein [Montipora capricornis]|uniref:uncharacterized protein isoform X2 n=1 Tax=Montipora capricornis TaxID=246305 RepID=UPI0035F20063
MAQLQLLFKIRVQDDSESDDAGVANPVERDRHEDDNYSSGEDLSSDEEGLQRPAFNSTPKRSSKSGNQATHTLPGTSLSGDTEVFVNTLYGNVLQ